MYDDSASCYRSETGFEYPVRDGIIDFLYDSVEQAQGERTIVEAYDALASEYDAILTSRTLFTKIYNFVFRGFVSDAFAYRVADFIPDDFHGTLVDAPVGTGVFTMEKYKKLGNALIVVVEYSRNMLLEAKRKYGSNGIGNVVYLHGDMRTLPLKDESVDLFFSMNGFHALPDKDLALDEAGRVLKEGARFSGCFYVRGKRRLTDRIVNRYHAKKGWFVPPFYSEVDVHEKFGRYFQFEEISCCKPILLFNGRKKA